MSHILNCYKKYATFSGRSTRAEFWVFFIYNFIVTLLPLIIAAVIYINHATDTIAQLQNTSTTQEFSDTLIPGMIKNLGIIFLYALPGILFAIINFIPFLAVGVRRLHDAGFPGWIMLLYYIGFSIVPFILWFFASKPGENEHGPNPHETAYSHSLQKNKNWHNDNT